MTFHFSPIGIIRTPHQDIEGMPIQPGGAANIAGRVELDDSFATGLQDLNGFSHCILIYEFHKSRGYALKVKPFLDSRER